jgi:hypothetical protein
MGIKIKNIRDHEFIGQIIESEDPMNIYRCKVKVVGLFEGVDDDMIPWFFPASTNSFASASGGAGNGSYPKVGTWVKVKFPHNDIFSGEYMGIPNLHPGLVDELDGDAENSHIFVYDVDESLKMMYTQAQGFIIQLGDEVINLKKEDGVLHISTTSQVFLETPEILTPKGHLVKYEEMKDMYDSHMHLGNLGAPTGAPLAPYTMAITEEIPISSLWTKMMNI